MYRTAVRFSWNATCNLKNPQIETRKLITPSWQIVWIRIPSKSTRKKFSISLMQIFRKLIEFNPKLLFEWINLRWKAFFGLIPIGSYTVYEIIRNRSDWFWIGINSHPSNLDIGVKANLQWAFQQTHFRIGIPCESIRKKLSISFIANRLEINLWFNPKPIWKIFHTYVYFPYLCIWFFPYQCICGNTRMYGQFPSSNEKFLYVYGTFKSMEEKPFFHMGYLRLFFTLFYSNESKFELIWTWN